MISVSIIGGSVKRTTAMFMRLQRKAPLAGAEVANQLAEYLRDSVKAHASGRPGPRVVTGAYRDSIQISQAASPGTQATATVTTDSPYAMRLEFGFTGIDSLGRHYAQPPFPHWRPALMETYTHLPEYSAIFISEMS